MIRQVIKTNKNRIPNKIPKIKQEYLATPYLVWVTAPAPEGALYRNGILPAMEPIAQRIALIRRLSLELRGFLAQLLAEDWSRPTPCELWQVGDIVAHLTGGAERQMASMLRGKAGDGGPPAGFVPLEVPALSAGNAQRDMEMRIRLGDTLLPSFSHRYDELQELLAGFGPNDWDVPCWHARRGTMTARDYLDLRIQELVIHHWDLHFSFDPTAGLDPEGASLLVDLAPTWLWMSFRPGARRDAPLSYRFVVQGYSPRRNTIRCQGDRFEVVPSDVDQADVEITCDAGPYLLFIYGRLSGAVASGQLTVKGDANLLTQFEQWFKGL